MTEVEKSPFFLQAVEKPWWQIELMILVRLYEFHLAQADELLRVDENQAVPAEGHLKVRSFLFHEQKDFCLHAEQGLGNHYLRSCSSMRQIFCDCLFLH